MPRLLTSCVLSALLMVPAIGSATTIVALPEAELSHRADAIAFGTIIDTRYVVSDRGRVSTVARFQVYRAVKGVGVGDIIELRVPGGRLPNGLISEAFGAPKLVAGAMHFGFLERQGDVYLPLGLSYGLLKARRDAAGGIHVWRETGGLAMLTPTGAAAPSSTTQLADIPLEQLIERVRGHLGREPSTEGFVGPGAVSP